MATNQQIGSDTTGETPSSARTTSRLAFALVASRLGTLFLLATALVVVSAIFREHKEFLEYSKWSLSVLLGAFGAWIGAGAAYFFGKENLTESSRSTEAALRIQQQTLRGRTRAERIKDLPLTAMNSDFLFDSSSMRKDVLEGLARHVDYWWVPVLDKNGKGVLEDVVHARVFWAPAFQDGDSIAKVLADLDTTLALVDLKPLHGSSFFVRVALDDGIGDVAEIMKKAGATVGVVTDEKGKPTYCFTRQQLTGSTA